VSADGARRAMKGTVAIDVTTALTQRAGVGRYTRELFEALAVLPDRPDLRPFYVAPAATYPLAAVPSPIHVNRSIRAWRLQMLARHALHAPAHGPWDGADLYHAPDVVYPSVGRRVPVVMTAHDLSYIVYPRYHTRLNGGYLRLITPAVTRDARLIIADSEATKRDLVERAGAPARKVRVIYPGVSAMFLQTPTPERVDAARARYGLTGPFILSVGTLEPRKNLTGTLGAYRLLRERMADAPPLALVGDAGWRLDDAAVFGASAGTWLRRLGFVPDDDLAALYAACDAFVYPSLYEGFGLPVAEALTLGAPVVTSNVSSLPEVAGDAALLADPRSVEEIAAALTRILQDKGLADRLRAEGPRRAARFTYEACAQQTVEVYREAMDG
jgi:glycosyltransferase involved in cell wall biosynthesis